MGLNGVNYRDGGLLIHKLLGTGDLKKTSISKIPQIYGQLNILDLDFQSTSQFLEQIGSFIKVTFDNFDQAILLALEHNTLKQPSYTA